MTVLDDLRKAQKEFQEPVDELCSKWKSVMPDDLAEAKAKELFDQQVSAMRYMTEHKNFICDIGMFKRKKNFRYENGVLGGWFIEEAPDHFKGCRNPAFYLKSFVYLIYDDSSDYNPRKIICGNIESVKKVYALAVKKLTAEGFKVTYEIRKSEGPFPRPYIDLKCILPCNENGEF